jgi:hypothetical protein
VTQSYGEEGEQYSPEKQHSDFMNESQAFTEWGDLRFPWGRQSAWQTLQSPRSQAYLRWLADQQEFRPDRYMAYLERVVGSRPHRTKRSYQLNRLRRKKRWI